MPVRIVAAPNELESKGDWSATPLAYVKVYFSGDWPGAVMDVKCGIGSVLY
jgi:hypothetical protein